MVRIVFWCQISVPMCKITRIFLLAITFSVGSHLWAKSGADQARSIKVEVIAPLSLEKSLEKGRPNHVSAASGIVEFNGRFYVNSDDETALFSWKEGEKYVTPFVLEARAMGVNKEIRKKLKPDYESLLFLEKKNWPPNGALVVWPSASNEQRYQAGVIPLSEKGELGPVQKVNIQALASTLSQKVEKLNLEGLTVHGDQLYVFNRGNGTEKGLKSGYFEMSLVDFIKGLKGGGWTSDVSFQKVKIGKLGGVKLTLADGLWTKYGFLGLAPAEDSENAITDGAVTGTVLVKIEGKKGKIVGRFDLNKKFEGFLAREVADGLEIVLVDDADDPNIPSHFYRARLSKKDLDSLAN